MLFKTLQGDSSRISVESTPFHEGWAYFTPDDGGFYIDSKVNGTEQRIKVRGSKLGSATLSALAWKDKKQSVFVSGIKDANHNGTAGLSQSATDEQYQAACNAYIRIIGQAQNSLTVEATGIVPTCDIPISVVLF